MGREASSLGLSSYESLMISLLRNYQPDPDCHPAYGRPLCCQRILLHTIYCPVLIKNSIVRNQFMEDYLRIILLYFSIFKLFLGQAGLSQRPTHLRMHVFCPFTKLLLTNPFLVMSSAYPRTTTGFSTEKLILCLLCYDCAII